MKRPIEILAGGFVLGELFVLEEKLMVLTGAVVLLLWLWKNLGLRNSKREKPYASSASFCGKNGGWRGKKKRFVGVLLFVLAMSVGMMWTRIAGNVPEESLIEGEVLVVQGIVDFCEEREDGVRITLKKGMAEQGERREEGTWYLYGEGMESLVPGNVIMAEGTLSYPKEAKNMGEFDYRMYCKAMGIRGQIFVESVQILSKEKEFVGSLFQKIRRICYTSLWNAEREDRALLSAMILGNRSGVEEGEYDRFSESGTAHLLSISALHLSIVGYSLFRLLSRMGAWFPLRFGLPVGIVWAYACFSGGSASALRAAIMFSVMMMGSVLGRTYDLRTGISMAALYLFGKHPLSLTLTGVQYSFAALFGIAFLAPRLHKCFPQKWLSGGMLNVAIFLTTLPVQCFYSYEFSPISPLLNGLMIPWMSLLLVLGIGGCVGAVLSPGVGKFFFLPTRGILWLYRIICQIPKGLSFGTIVTGQPTLTGLLLYGVALIWIVKKIEKKKKYIGLIVLLPLFLIKPPMTDLTIHFLDVGQGDCTIIQCPGGKTIMVDGGSTSNSNLYSYTLEPFLKANRIRKLEVVVVTHMDEDHTSAIDDLLQEEVKVELLLLPSRKEKNEKQEKLKKLAGHSYEISQGEGFSFGEVNVTCLSPKKEAEFSDENAYSVVCLLEYKGFTCLFAGDLGEEGEQKLLEDGYLSDVDVLKVGHHGSRYSTSEEFLQRIRPEVAIISCQEDNHYGHPHQQTLLRLEEAKSKIWITAKSGQISITAGRKWKLQEFCYSV